MSNLNDPLAGLYAEEEPVEEADPLAGLYEQEDTTANRGHPKAFVNEEAEEQPPLSVEEWQAQQNANIEAYRQGQLDPVGNLAKGTLSGATFGGTENIQALTPTHKEGDLVGNVAANVGRGIGSLLPISRLFKIFGAPLVMLAEKSPILAKQLSSLANIVGWAATGAAEEVITKAVKGEVPKAEDVLVHGVEWGALDAGLQATGLLGRWTLALGRAVSKWRKKPVDVVNDTLNKVKELGLDITADTRAIPKALEILEEAPPITGADLRNRRVSDLSIHNMENRSSELAERYVPTEVNFEAEANALERSPVEAGINATGVRAESEHQLGLNIQNTIETQFREAEELYRPLYATARAAAFQRVMIPQRSAFVGTSILQNLSSITTRPAGYEGVIRAVETALHDAGFEIERDAAGRIVQAISRRDVPVSNMMELGRRLNEIIDYEIVGNTIKKRLTPLVRAVKRDVRAGLRGDRAALRAYNDAERLYAETAERFSTERIRKIRGEQSPEKIAKEVENASGLGELRATVTPQQYAQIEREVLERMQGMSYDKSREFLRNVREQLSNESQQLARDIVRSKSPNAPRNKTARIQKGVLNELADSMSTGTRPSKTLNLWKTTKGQRIVRDAFRDSPNARNIERYLQEQSIKDFADSVISTDGKINFKTLRDMMKDPATVENLRRVGGEEAVNFFNSLETKVQQLEGNGRWLAHELPKTTPTTKIGKQEGARGRELLEKGAAREFPVKTAMDNLLSTLGIAGQTTLTLFGVFRYGLTKGALAVVGKEILYRFAKSPKARRGFNRASKPNATHDDFIKGLVAMDEGLNEE